jgi:basic amino acid/polyamine antiporter, APA family
MTTKRQIGMASATCLVVANMIGIGVFTSSGYLMGDLKSGWTVVFAWMLGGLIALMGATCYGALVRRIPESGGEYVFLSRTVHPAAGYLAGWVSLLAGFSAPLALVAFGMGAYMKDWLEGWPPQLIGSIALVAFAAVHALHVQRGAWLQNVAVIAKVLLIGLFMVLAFWRLEVPAVTSEAFVPHLPTLAVSLVWISFGYSGWNAAIYLAGEVRDAERTVPRAMLLGTGIVIAIYVLLNAVFVFAPPAGEIIYKEQVGRIAAMALGGEPWANALTALIVLALLTSISSMTMTGPRVYARMASDGYLPGFLKADEGPPRTAIALQLGLALVLLWSATFDSLLTYIGFTLSLSTAVTVVGLILLRKREGTRVRVPGWPVVPVLFLLFVLFMTSFSIWRKPQESLIGVATLGLGLVAWKLSESRRAARAAKIAVGP